MIPSSRRSFIQAGVASLFIGISGCLNANSKSPTSVQDHHRVDFSFVNDSEHKVTISLSVSDTDAEGAQVEEIHYIDGQGEFQDEFVIRPGETAIWLGISGENIRGGSYEDTITIESDVSIETTFDGETVRGDVERQ